MYPRWSSLCVASSSSLHRPETRTENKCQKITHPRLTVSAIKPQNRFPRDITHPWLLGGASERAAAAPSLCWSSAVPPGICSERSAQLSSALLQLLGGFLSSTLLVCTSFQACSCYWAVGMSIIHFQSLPHCRGRPSLEILPSPVFVALTLSRSECDADTTQPRRFQCLCHQLRLCPQRFGFVLFLSCCLSFLGSQADFPFQGFSGGGPFP